MSTDDLLAVAISEWLVALVKNMPMQALRKDRATERRHVGRWDWRELLSVQPIEHAGFECLRRDPALGGHQFSVVKKMIARP